MTRVGVNSAGVPVCMAEAAVFLASSRNRDSPNNCFTKLKKLVKQQGKISTKFDFNKLVVVVIVLLHVTYIPSLSIVFLLALMCTECPNQKVMCQNWQLGSGIFAVQL